MAELAAGFDSASIIQLAAPAMADLRAVSRETVNLGVVQRNRLVWAASFDGAYSLRHTTNIGEAVSMHSTAAGKAVLARDVELARKRGWAVDLEEMEMSGICVGAAILGRDRRPVAAISLCSVAGRLPDALRDEFGRSVRRWCDQISVELTGQTTRHTA